MPDLIWGSPRLGLSRLYPAEAEQSARIDIILVHGVDGHPIRSWEASDRTLWPMGKQDVRVLTFRHSVTAKRPCDSKELTLCSETLLRELAHHREKPNVVRLRPIIFVGHDVGGIIIKKALLDAQCNPRYSDITHSTYGIAFFATPHRSIGSLNWIEIFSRLFLSSLVFRTQVPDDLLGQEDLKWLDSVSRQFRNSSAQLGLRVVSFTEGQPLKWLGKRIVEGSSAELEPHDRFVHQLEGDHHQICKHSRGSPGFKVVWEEIDGIERKSPKAKHFHEQRRQALLSLGVMRIRPFQTPVFPLQGTCTWIERQDKFQQWIRRDPGKSKLWIRGAPGRGKTHLARHIVGLPDIRVDTIAYCSLGDIKDGKRTASAVLLCLLHDIFLAHPKLISECLIGNQPRNDEDEDDDILYQGLAPWKKIWADVLERATKGERTLTVVIDGLDQCPDNQDTQYDFLNWISGTADELTHIDKARFRVLVLSCNHAPVSDLPPPFVTINIQSEHTESDILVIAQKSAKWIARRHKGGEELESTISQQIVKRASGMHLWARVMLDQLENETKLNETRLKTLLDNQPPGMIPCYESILKGITESGEMEFVRGVLFWLTYQVRPMTAAELKMACEMVDVMGILRDPNEGVGYKRIAEADVDRINNDVKVNFVGKVYQCCKKLVVVDKGGQFRLVHQSLKDYLMNSGAALLKELRWIGNRWTGPGLELVYHRFYHRFGPGQADKWIADLCMAYLLLDYFADPGPPYKPDDALSGKNSEWAGKIRRRIRDHRFCSYAALHWLDHVNLSAKLYDAVLQPGSDLDIMLRAGPHNTCWSEVRFYLTKWQTGEVPPFAQSLDGHVDAVFRTPTLRLGPNVRKQDRRRPRAVAEEITVEDAHPVSGAISSPGSRAGPSPSPSPRPILSPGPAHGVVPTSPVPDHDPELVTEKRPRLSYRRLWICLLIAVVVVAVGVGAGVSVSKNSSRG